MQPESRHSGLRGPAGAALGALGLVVVIVALAALLDLGPFEDEDAAALSKAEFIATGDEICERAHDQFAELQPNPAATPEAAAATQRELIEIAESEVAQIRALDAPPDLEAARDRYLRAREQGIDLLKRGLDAAESKDAFAYDAAKQEVAAGQVHRLKLAQAVGFSECSRPIPQG
jgi:hypothetical protein